MTRMQDESESTGKLLHRIGFARLLNDRLTSDLAAAFLAANGDEGTVWLIDPGEENLVAQYNSGPDAERIVGFPQPLGRGLISMVFETEQAFCENEMQGSHEQDKRLDRHVGKPTQSLIAVPFGIGGETCGVISCVRLGHEASDRGGFTGKDLDLITRAAEVFQDAIGRSLAS